MVNSVPGFELDVGIVLDGEGDVCVDINGRLYDLAALVREAIDLGAVELVDVVMAVANGQILADHDDIEGGL